MRNRRSTLLSAALVAASAAALGGGAAPASAATYCVDDPACKGIPVIGLQQALDFAAASTASADRVEVGPGVFTADKFDYEAGTAQNALVLEGTPGQTILRSKSALQETTNDLLRVYGNGSAGTVVRDIAVEMAAGTVAEATGIQLEDATGERLVVRRTGPGTVISQAFKLTGDVHLRDSEVALPEGTEGLGIGVSSGEGAVVEDVRIRGMKSGMTVTGASGTARVSRALIDARGHGIRCIACSELDVDDTVIRLHGADNGILVSSLQNSADVDVSHVTIVGDDVTKANAVRVTGGVGATATVRIDNCVLDGVKTTLSAARDAGANASVQLVARFCNYAPNRTKALNGATIDDEAITAHDPGFADAAAGDLRLTSASGLLDRARAGKTFALSPMTLDRQPRIADGNGDGTPVPDIGAYEFVPHAPTARIDGPTSAKAGQPITLDSAGSADQDPREALTRTWTLPNGTTASTPAVTLTLPAGRHTVAVEVADPTGRKATATHVVEVARSADDLMHGDPHKPGVIVPSTTRPLLSGLELPKRVKAGRMPVAKLVLGTRAGLTLRLERRSGRRWRSGGKLERTLDAGRHAVKLPRVRRKGTWRLTVTAKTSAAQATARRTFRVR